MRVPFVVAVEKREEPAGGRPEGRVARRPGSRVGLAQDAHARVVARKLLCERHRPVRRSVVDDQQLQIAIRLAQDELDGRRQISFGVERRHHDADVWHVSTLAGEPGTGNLEPGTFSSLIASYSAATPRAVAAPGL